VPIGPPNAPATPARLAHRVSGWGPDVNALATSLIGTWFVLSLRCADNCDNNPKAVHRTVLRSTDLGATWTVIGQLRGVDTTDFAPRLLAADDNHIWVAHGTSVDYTSDGGGHWQRQELTGEPVADAAVNDGTAWFAAAGGTVLRAAAGTAPQPTAAQPPGVLAIESVIADSADAATVLGMLDGVSAAWFTTTDRGVHWTRTADPCAGTPAAGSLNNRMSVGADGARWAACAPTKPDQGRIGLRVTTDGGRTWQPRGDLGPRGNALGLHARSVTAAWHEDLLSGIHRMADGMRWAEVLPGDRVANWIGSFYPILDEDSGIYFDSDPTGANRFSHLTRDGGQTWTTVPFHPPSP
jgi:hypothetical protein